MTVADRIAICSRTPHALVVYWDHASDALLSKLGFDDVQPIQLGSRESNGVLLLEPWTASDEQLQGPYPG